MGSEKDKNLYLAFKSCDVRFDGRFFVAVTSTGIYCRPTCKARMPKEENCLFFESAAEAEKEGFRPCLLCRPELAPNLFSTNENTELANLMARFLEENCGNGNSISELAARLGYSDRHLRRVFAEEYHVSPIQYVQTCRLLLAKGLLTDTTMSIMDVAMASGFGSLRRFNAVFKTQYKMSPTQLRKAKEAQGTAKSGIKVELGYRPPYQWDRMLSFLSDRAIPGVEVVRDGQYSRTVRIKGSNESDVLGWIIVSNNDKKNTLRIIASESLMSVLPQLLGRVRSLFDLYCDPQAVEEALASMNGLKQGIYETGIRVPGCMDPFELSSRAVLGQQITVRAAGTLAGRMAEKFGTSIDTGIEGLDYVFPSSDMILKLGDSIEENLGMLGIIASRSRAIRQLAKVISEETINFNLCTSPEEEIKKLVELPGIGPWTAKYIAMRSMGWTDGFLDTDLGVKKALANIQSKDGSDNLSSNEIKQLAEKWSPWGSYATMTLWNSL